MTKEEQKEILLKDLSSRLIYGVKVRLLDDKTIEGIRTINELILSEIRWHDKLYLPYLRPMESMTEEEHHELVMTFHEAENEIIFSVGEDEEPDYFTASLVGDMAKYDWLNKNHFDYRGMIPLGLAIKVTPENNPYKK